MTLKELTRVEINEKLNKLPDFSKIDYLERCMTEKQDIDTRKFCNTKLADLYLRSGMPKKAAQNMEALARLAITHEEKMNYYLEAVKLLIKTSDYQQAEKIFDLSISFASPSNKINLKKEYIQLLKDQADKLERELKRSGAVIVYEILYKVADDIDKKFIREKLINYYEKLGRIKDLYMLKSM